MNSLYRRILFKYAISISSWDIFHNEMKILEAKFKTLPDLPKLATEEATKLGIDLSVLVDFYENMDYSESFDMDGSKIKNEIENKLKELQSIINKINPEPPSNTIKFAHNNFYLYKFIIACKEQLLIFKSSNRKLVLNTLLKKYSNLNFSKEMFSYLFIADEVEGIDLKETIIIIGKLLSFVNINNNIYNLNEHDIDHNFIATLKMIKENNDEYFKNKANSKLALYIIINKNIKHAEIIKWLEDSISGEDVPKLLDWKLENDYLSMSGLNRLLNIAYLNKLNDYIDEILKIIEKGVRANTNINISHVIPIITKIKNDIGKDNFESKYPFLYDLLF